MERQSINGIILIKTKIESLKCINLYGRREKYKKN